MNAPVNDHSKTGAAIPLVPSLERRRVRIYLFMVLLDVAILLGSFALVSEAYAFGRASRSNLFEAQLLLPLYLTLALYQPTYSINSLQTWQFAARKAIWALALSAALLLFVTFFAKSTAVFSRVVLTGGLVTTASMLLVSRVALASWIRRSWGMRVINTLVIDAGGPAVPLANAFRLDAGNLDVVPDSSSPRALDRLGRYLLNMDRVVVSCPFETRSDWSRVLRAAGVRGEIVTDRLEDLAPIGLAVEDGWRSLVVSTGPLGLRQRVMKRGFDCVVAVGAAIVLAPVMALTAIAIKLEDGGPILFVQPRLGRGNRFFDMLKFRSMRSEASDHAGNRSTARDDDRTTRVGRFIRRTSIDELPQLFNVIAGDMSIVGPRPHAIGSQAGSKLFWEVDGAYWNRHTLKPGLTGLAQIRGYRGATDEERHLVDRLDADLEYIADWSLWTDALIVLKTIGVVIHPRAF